MADATTPVQHVLTEAQTPAVVAEMQALLAAAPPPFTTEPITPQQALPEHPAEAPSAPTPAASPQPEPISADLAERASLMGISAERLASVGAANVKNYIEDVERQAGDIALRMLGGAQLFDPQNQIPSAPSSPSGAPAAPPQPKPVQAPPVPPSSYSGMNELPAEFVQYLNLNLDPQKYTPEFTEVHGKQATALRKLVEYQQSREQQLQANFLNVATTLFNNALEREFDADLNEVIANSPDLEKTYGRGRSSRLPANDPRRQARQELFIATQRLPVQSMDPLTKTRVMAIALHAQKQPKATTQQPSATTAPRAANGQFTSVAPPLRNGPPGARQQPPAQTHQQAMAAAVADLKALPKNG